MAEDMRVRRTKRLLKSAFSDLIGRAPLNKISVKALAEHAGVSKQAFYLHYSDIYALADEWVTDRIGEMVADMDFLEAYYRDPREFVFRLGGTFSASKEFGQLLFRNDLHLVFLQQFTDAVVSRLVELRPRGSSEKRAEVAGTMAISGLLALPPKYGAVPLELPQNSDPMGAVAEDAAAVITAVNAAL